MSTEKLLSAEETSLILDIMQSKIMNSESGGCNFKKCCEKYKKGKRCKKCPLR